MITYPCLDYSLIHVSKKAFVHDVKVLIYKDGFAPEDLETTSFASNPTLLGLSHLAEMTEKAHRVRKPGVNTWLISYRSPSVLLNEHMMYRHLSHKVLLLQLKNGYYFIFANLGFIHRVRSKLCTRFAPCYILLGIDTSRFYSHPCWFRHWQVVSSKCQWGTWNMCINIYNRKHKAHENRLQISWYIMFMKREDICEAFGWI